MNVKTARIISFVLSISGLIVAVYYLMNDHKETNKNLMYVGLSLLLASIVLRNLVRFKPEWFQDKNRVE
jgi:hypothetical protein